MNQKAIKIKEKNAKYMIIWEELYMKKDNMTFEFNILKNH